VPLARLGRGDSELSLTVIRDGDARVVLAGCLDPSGARFVHDALAALLRDADRVLVDIVGLTVTRTSLLHVFPEALDAAGGWPAARLAVAYRGEGMRQALHASRVARRIAVSDEPDLALLRCAEQPGQVRAQWELPGDREAPRCARRRLAMQLLSWSCPDITAVHVELVLAELVTNAVLHAGTRVLVTLLLDEDGLRVGVRDFNPTRPLAGLCGPPGFGLRLVQHLSTRWGADAHADGKTVWARFGRSRPDPETLRPDSDG
jgi:hypothetical protein